jgi:hypothetical protein
MKLWKCLTNGMQWTTLCVVADAERWMAEEHGCLSSPGAGLSGDANRSESQLPSFVFGNQMAELCSFIRLAFHNLFIRRTGDQVFSPYR